MPRGYPRRWRSFYPSPAGLLSIPGRLSCGSLDKARQQRCPPAIRAAQGLLSGSAFPSPLLWWLLFLSSASTCMVRHRSPTAAILILVRIGSEVMQIACSMLCLDCIRLLRFSCWCLCFILGDECAINGGDFVRCDLPD